MSDQPVFGEWTIQVVAQGQIEEVTFLVEEYYQTRFEVYFIYFIINILIINYKFIKFIRLMLQWLLIFLIRINT